MKADNLVFPMSPPGPSGRITMKKKPGPARKRRSERRALMFSNALNPEKSESERNLVGPSRPESRVKELAAQGNTYSRSREFGLISTQQSRGHRTRIRSRSRSRDFTIRIRERSRSPSTKCLKLNPTIDPFYNLEEGEIE